MMDLGLNSDALKTLLVLVTVINPKIEMGET